MTLRGFSFLRPWILVVLFFAGGVMHLSDSALASPGSPQAPKEDSKISLAIRDVLQQMQDMAVTRSNASYVGVSSLSVDGFLEIDEVGRIQTYIFVIGAVQDKVTELEDYEVVVEVTNGELGVIQGWVPFDRVEELAGLDFIKRIQTPDYPHVRVGSALTEGDQILRADEVRSLLGVIGSGIRIGVISDGVDSLASAQSAGDLPGGIEIDSARPGSGDEGTAMLEIIHDLAPGA